MSDLSGSTVAFLAMDNFEDSELTSPWQAVTDAGGRAVLLSPGSGSITGKKGHEQPVDLEVGQASAEDYDALVLPGGTGNADHLRTETDAVDFVTAFVATDRPIAVICHGPWILTEADAVRGRRMTSFKSLATDLRNAGADWVDEEVVVDGNLITSRTPEDLPAFNQALLAALGD